MVVLGAGASISAGLPSLAGIFGDPSVQNYLATGAQDFHKFMQQEVWGRRGLNEIEAWETLNLEEVLTMLRQWASIQLPDGTRVPNPYSPLNHSVNTRLRRQLLGCVYHSVYVNKSGKSARDYNRLIELADTEFDLTTWATFNWDALLEQAFYYQFYKLARYPRCHPALQDWDGSDNKHLLLKLHGSVTWFFDASGEVFYAKYGKTGNRNEVVRLWEDYLQSASDCLRPMIAEPSFFKHEDLASRPFLLDQWNEFQSAVSLADLVLIIGYSLPDGDALAKQSLLTAVARKAPPQFVVVDPSEDVLKRYQRVLGSPRLSEKHMAFGDFLNTHSSLLPLLA